MDIKDEGFGIPEAKNKFTLVIFHTYIIGLLFLITGTCSTAYAENAIINSDERPYTAQSYIFDSPIALAQQINSELSEILNGTTIRIINGGILNKTDFEEWSDQMGKNETVNYQRAFYMAFTDDNGPKSLAGIRVTDKSGNNSMNCMISHPHKDWHAAWNKGGLNMSMHYNNKDYNLNDISNFILYHESKHCISNNKDIAHSEKLADTFAALLYRSHNSGKTVMLEDLIGFRQYQLDMAEVLADNAFTQSARDHDSRNALQKVIDLNYESDLKDHSISKLNSLANSIVDSL